MFERRGEVEALESAGVAAALACVGRAEDRLRAAALLVEAKTAADASGGVKMPAKLWHTPAMAVDEIFGAINGTKP